MAALWEKESNCSDALWVDLFAADRKNHKVFAEWDRKIRTSEWTSHFLGMNVKPVKNNKVSDSFRNDGNMYFRMEQWVEAMEMYTQSVRFAEIGTKSMSLAYANRASCFLRMKQYDKCLIDIELAIEAKYPADLMPKLIKRKNDCEEAMENDDDQATPFKPKLSFDPNEKFPCMADVLEIQRNAEFGRHIVAKCDIDVGQTILVEENFVSITAGFDRANCYTCLQAMQNFIPCTNCTDVMFCCEDCRSQNDVHQQFCGAAINRMPTNVKLIAKSILFALTTFSSVDELMEFVDDVLSKRATEIPEAANDARSKYGLFLSLQPAPKTSIDQGTIYKVYTGLLDAPAVKKMFDSKQRQRFLMHLVAEHFLIISNNSYGGSLSSESSVCTLACVMSLFNHACAPNAFNSSAGNREVCITMRPIKKGQQVFVKYLCGDRTTRQRQEMLLNQWGFVCKCDKCIPISAPADRKRMQSDPMFKALLSNVNVLDWHFQILQSGEDYDGISNQPKLTKACEEFLRKYGQLPWCEEMEQVLKTYTKCLLHDFPSM